MFNAIIMQLVLFVDFFNYQQHNLPLALSFRIFNMLAQSLNLQVFSITTVFPDYSIL